MSDEQPAPFFVKDCTLATIATGSKAQTLTELGERIAAAPPGCIHHHFWEGKLTTVYQAREYHNDFANWVHRHLHDDILAERLDLINPTDYEDTTIMRNDLIELISNRVEELDIIPGVTKENRFYFIRSKIIVFWTPYSVTDPRDFIQLLPQLPLSSIYYHVIDAARRLPSRGDDFSTWLGLFEGRYQPLIDALRKIDPYFITLPTLQERLTDTFVKFYQKEVGT